MRWLAGLAGALLLSGCVLFHTPSDEALRQDLSQRAAVAREPGYAAAARPYLITVSETPAAAEGRLRETT